MPGKEDKKADPAPRAPCFVRDQPGGGLSVTFQVGPLETARLKSRAGPMDLSRYIYENILKQAISSAVF